MIPMYAWASELYSDSVERTSLFTAVSFAGLVGGLLFYLIPFLPLFETREITPETLRVSVVIGSILLLVGLYYALKYVPNGPLVLVEELAEKGKSNQPKTSAFKGMYSAVKTNKPFQVFMLAYLCFGLGMGMFYGLFFIFVDAFLGQGEIFATWRLSVYWAVCC